MKKLLSSLAFALALVAVPAASQAGTPATSVTVRVQTGSTTLNYESSFRATLTANGIVARVSAPGVLVQSTGAVRLPISWGAFTLTDLRGEVLHTGGILLRKGTVRVSLTNFIVVTPATGTGGAASVSALVTVNGRLQGRVNVFNLDLSGAGLTAPVVLPVNKTLRIRNTDLSLSAEGAATLNTAFGITGFFADQAVGTLNLRLITSGRF